MPLEARALDRVFDPIFHDVHTIPVPRETVRILCSPEGAQS